ncbi:MAG: xanthine dehydrogenase family protein [Chromatiales bacterium]|nr:xanthine dehydrogenase family protein [Chromatiales bacterium]
MRFAIGQSAPRVEDLRLLTGRGRFTDDLGLPGQAHACLVRSPHPHARIEAVDTTAAARAPGVLAIITGADVVPDGLGPLPTFGSTLPGLRRADGEPLFVPPWWPLATERVRFVGEGVAMVVAETAAAARDAADRVEVEYTPLPAVAAIGEAVRPGAPVVWDDCPDNVAFEFRNGDAAAVERAFARAAHVERAIIPITRVCANPLEPLAVLAEFDPLEERYTLRTGNQMPHLLRRFLAQDVLRVPESRIRVVSPDMGGSFGLRASPFPEIALALWAARHLGRPVKLVVERGEMMTAIDQAREVHYTVELALDADGTFLALRLDGLAALGAYLTFFGPFPAFGNLGGLAGPYRTPAIHARVRGVLSHTGPTSPYRGAGRPEASLAIEQVIDRAARAMGIDRIELRRRNLIAPSQMPFQTGLNFRYDSGEFEAVLDAALTLADHAGFEARRAEARGRGRLRGMGVAMTVEASAGMLDEAADIRLDPGGDAVVHMGTHSHGQGHETVFRQLVAERLGLDFERIRYVQGDTDLVAYGVGTGGSRASGLGGAALSGAVDRLIEQARKVAAHLLEVADEDVEHAAGEFRVAGTDRRVSLDEVARAAHHPALRGRGIEGGLRGHATFTPPGPTFPNGCHLCEVEVDPDTGEIVVLGYWVVEDVGTVLNPRLLRGQLQGGIAQGLGQVLQERMVFDADGQPLTGSFMDYAMPRADQVPGAVIETHPVPTPTNPLGVKGAGEAGTVGAIACVTSAIADALAPLGVTTLDMPATPHRVWEAIRRAR